MIKGITNKIFAFEDKIKSSEGKFDLEELVLLTKDVLKIIPRSDIDAPKTPNSRRKSGIKLFKESDTGDRYTISDGVIYCNNEPVMPKKFVKWYADKYGVNDVIKTLKHLVAKYARVMFGDNLIPGQRWEYPYDKTAPSFRTGDEPIEDDGYDDFDDDE